MKITATYQGGMQFDSVGDASNHQVTMDAKPDIGGNDTGPRPMEMLLHGVAGCMGIDLVNIMRHHMDKIDDIKIEVNGERHDGTPGYFTKVHVTVFVKGDVTEKVALRAVQLSHEKYCSAIQSLSAAVTSELVLNG